MLRISFQLLFCYFTVKQEFSDVKDCEKKKNEYNNS